MHPGAGRSRLRRIHFACYFADMMKWGRLVVLGAGIVACGGGQIESPPPTPASTAPTPRATPGISPTDQRATAPTAQCTPKHSKESDPAWGDWRPGSQWEIVRYCDGSRAMIGDENITKYDASKKVVLYAAAELWGSSLDSEGRPAAGLFVVYESGKCRLGKYAAGKKQGVWRTWNDESQCQSGSDKKQKNGEERDRKGVILFDPAPANNWDLDEFEVFVDGAPAGWPELAKAVDETCPKPPSGYQNDFNNEDDKDDQKPREFMRAFQSAGRQHPEVVERPEYKALADKSRVLEALGRLARKDLRHTHHNGPALSPREVDELKALCEKDGQAQACRQCGSDHAAGAASREWFGRACKLGDNKSCREASSVKNDQTLPASTNAANVKPSADRTPARPTSKAGSTCSGSRQHPFAGNNFSLSCDNAGGDRCFIARLGGSGSHTEAQMRAAASACCCDVR